MTSTFLQACRGERVEKVPVWFMRQAGRSLPGYRELRKTYGMLELTQIPELSAKVSREPVELLGVDAAILFADIMILPIAMGVELKIIDSVGPIINKPIDTPADVQLLSSFSEKRAEFLAETIRILRANLSVPIIGFAGAPFTLASYLIEGKPSRTWHKTKRFMMEHPESWHALMGLLSNATIEYLRLQIKAGAQAVQLFDSWVGCLSPLQYREFVLPHVQKIFSSLKEESVPRIHFGTNTSSFLQDFSNVDAEVIGVDWRIELKEARRQIPNKTIQGNLDPAILLTPWGVIQKSVDGLFEQVDFKKGYIFNLGHGMPPEADHTVIKKLVSYVHSK